MSEFRRNILTAMNKSEPPITKDYLTIVALEDGLTAKLSINACEYCVDGDGNWKTLPADTETETINAGQTLSFRGELTPTYHEGVGTFTVSKQFNLKGNGMSLLFGDNAKKEFSLSGRKYAFSRLFELCTKIIDASEFLLQATVLSEMCYFSMFNACTFLVAPPKLPATNLAYRCYETMFNNCRSLTVAPELPAKTLAGQCYFAMFNDCTSLTISPVLPAPKLYSSCYKRMFATCPKLNYIKMLATDISATDCLYNWVVTVASSGTFVKSKDATWDVTGANGIPNGWEVITE